MNKSCLYIIFFSISLFLSNDCIAQDHDDETIIDTTVSDISTPEIIIEKIYVNPEIYIKQDSAISEEKKQCEKFKKQIAQQDSAMAKKKREVDMEKRNFEQKKKVNAEEYAMIQAKKREAAAERSKKIAAMRELKQKIYTNSKIQISEIIEPENENGNIEAIVDEKRVEIKFNKEKAIWEIIAVYKNK